MRSYGTHSLVSPTFSSTTSFSTSTSPPHLHLVRNLSLTLPNLPSAPLSPIQFPPPPSNLSPFPPLSIHLFLDHALIFHFLQTLAETCHWVWGDGKNLSCQISEWPFLERNFDITLTNFLGDFFSHPLDFSISLLSEIWNTKTVYPFLTNDGPPPAPEIFPENLF